MLQTPDFLSHGLRHTWFCDRVQTLLVGAQHESVSRQGLWGHQPSLPHTEPLRLRRSARQQHMALFQGYYHMCYLPRWCLSGY